MLRPLGNVWRRASLPLLVAAVAALLAPATALAAARGGAAGDPAGDASSPGADLVALAARYDSAGSVSVAVTLGAAPSGSPAGVAVRLGRASPDGTCAGAPFVVLAAVADPADPESLMRSSEERDLTTPALSFNGATVSLSAGDPWLANREWDCAYALVADARSRTDDLDAPLTMVPESDGPGSGPGDRPRVLTRRQQLSAALAACAERPRAARGSCAAGARLRYGRLAQRDRLSRDLVACSTRSGRAARASCEAIARERFAKAVLALSRNHRLFGCGTRRLAGQRALCRRQTQSWYAAAVRAVQLRRALAVCATVAPAPRRAACRAQARRHSPPPVRRA